MFKKEIDLVNDFVKIFKNKYGKTYVRKEVFTPFLTKTDLVIKKSNESFSFEAKLNNISDVWIQALKNKKLYQYSYVVLPSYKRKIIMDKHIDYFLKYGIGVILVGNNDLEFLNKIDSIL